MESKVNAILHFRVYEVCILSNRDDDTFQSRQSAAAAARSVTVRKFQARAKANDPAVLEVDRKRRAISEARDARLSLRASERAEREAAELSLRRAKEDADAAAIATMLAEAEAIAAANKHEADELKAKLEVEKKAERDARYAARKVRKKERKQERKREINNRY